MGTSIGPDTRVVVVDPDAGAAVERALEELGVTTDVVRTADACLGTLSNADCVVITGPFPTDDSVELCRAISERRSDVPIVVYPDDGSETLAGAVVAAGADGYVPRSQGAETLVTRVRELLADRPALDGRSSVATADTVPTDAVPLKPTDASSDRLELLVEQSPLAIVEWDLEFEVRNWNAAATELFGYTRDEALGESAVGLIIPERNREAVRELRETLADGGLDGESFRQINSNVRKDGTTITCEWFNTPLVDDDGEIESVLAFAQDITDERKRANALEALQETTQELLRAESTDEIADIVMAATEDVIDRPLGAIRFYDEETERLELAGITSVLERYTGDISSIGTEYTALWDTYTEGEPTIIENASMDRVPYDIETGVENAVLQPLGDHGILSVASSGTNELDAAEIHLVNVLATTAEAALDRIAFEERLRAERDRFAALFENVPDAVVSATLRDGEPIVQAVNPAFERVFGYDEATLVDEPLDQFIVPATDRDETEAINRRSGRGEIVEAEVTRRTVDGMRDFMMRIVPMETDGSSDHTFGLYTDVTAQKQRQKHLEILNRVLRHDLRNGMNIINGCAEMLADAVDGADDEYVETIRERTSELIGLAEKTRAVEQVLDRDEAAAGPIDLTAAIEQAVSRIETDHPDVEITSSLPDRAFARADEYLQTAVFQVLENAVEHSDRPRPTVDVTLCDRPDDESLTLSIADDGPGIPDEERELLEGEREITQLRHGSGLGLWLVNWVVTRAGGRFSFADNEPRGTVVTLEVPRADAESIRSTSDGTATGD